ncbi:hypothetical protein KIN20_017750 [Parelaphostrongylus tenuis]|uniref:Receptor expression-enhancing protein n=1 Tax=Parelaphostrongylus tenuis TaxID=148309 RepID=A0AAD5N173_PARTN|nr:hypothetical protein KIN20_017750 [Parelaphostrongylus tenuis]
MKHFSATMFSLLCQLASAFVGAVIPVFYSYKTIKRPSQKQLSYWSKYWSVFGSFLAVDAVLNTLFIHYFIPFYDFGKLLFLIWAVIHKPLERNSYSIRCSLRSFDVMKGKWDTYVEHVVNKVVTHGPSFLLTVGTALWTVARNVSALSNSKGGEELTIAEIDYGEDGDRVERLPIAVLPVETDIKMEPDSDDGIVCLDDTRIQNGQSKLTVSQAPSEPTGRKCPRRVASSGRRRTAKKNQELEEEKQKDNEEQGKRKTARRPRRVAAAKRHLVIAEDTESGTDV